MDLQFKWMIFLCILVTYSLTDDVLPKHITTFIQAVETIEADNPGLEPLAVLKGLRKAANVDSAFIQNYLGTLYDAPDLVLNPRVAGFISSILKHRVVRNVEHGVVLTNDGHTVALTPLLLGLEAGLKSTSLTRFRALYSLSITKNLALSFLHHSQSKSSNSSRLGPQGCWNSVSNPQVFTLPGVASLATDALINGGMDGVILGKHVAEPSNRPLKLSSLLNQYYNHQLDSAGLDGAPALISQRRRSIFKNLITLPLLLKKLPRSLAIYQRLHSDQKKIKGKMEIMTEGLKEFLHTYIDCPSIIPRCMWEGDPYRGAPTTLSLPLSFLFVHHTYEPSQSCLTFKECSRDMRAMQSFHQNTRGWDDIGYSFVAGSDGNMYEGRGWSWQGAHTRGYNSKGYGVAIIGDFNSSRPSQQTLDLVRNQLPKCATDGGYLVSNYVIHGHRQLVSTECPGNALYNEIRKWKHFEEVKGGTGGIFKASH